PQGFDIPYDAERVHGISTELAMAEGVPLAEVLDVFAEAVSQAKFIVGQNLNFDVNIMGCEFHRLGMDSPLQGKAVLDTCTEVTATMLQLPGGRGGKFKLPTLTELHAFLFSEPFAEAHNATADVEATARCFFELIKRDVYPMSELGVAADYFTAFRARNPQIKAIGLKHRNLKEDSKALRASRMSTQTGIPSKVEISDELRAADFAHLHNHSQFSVLQSTISVPALVKAAADQNMPAVAITDVGNMMGAFQFVSAVMNQNKAIAAKNQEALENGGTALWNEIKPIVGCEFFICDDHTDKSRKDN